MPAATVVGETAAGHLLVELENEPGQLWAAKLISQPGNPAWVYLQRLGPIEDELQVINDLRDPEGHG